MPRTYRHTHVVGAQGPAHKSPNHGDLLFAGPCACLLYYRQELSFFKKLSSLTLLPALGTDFPYYVALGLAPLLFAVFGISRR